VLDQSVSQPFSFQVRVEEKFRVTVPVNKFITIMSHCYEFFLPYTICVIQISLKLFPNIFVFLTKFNNSFLFMSNKQILTYQKCFKSRWLRNTVLNSSWTKTYLRERWSCHLYLGNILYLMLKS